MSSGRAFAVKFAAFSATPAPPDTKGVIWSDQSYLLGTTPVFSAADIASIRRGNDGNWPHLDIELTETPRQITPHLYNKAATPTARIVKIALRLEAVERSDDDVEFRPLTEAEWERVVLEQQTIRLRSALPGSEIVEHTSPSGRFTLLQLAKAIEETERRTRVTSEWFGGVDVHHVFFQGLDLQPDGVWSISWGS